MSCGVGCRCGSDPSLLWLWHRPGAAAPIRPLAWEPLYAEGAAQRNSKKDKTNKQTKKPHFSAYPWGFLVCLHFLDPLLQPSECSLIHSCKKVYNTHLRNDIYEIFDIEIQLSKLLQHSFFNFFIFFPVQVHDFLFCYSILKDLFLFEDQVYIY